MNKILVEDIQRFTKHFELREQLTGKTFLITGATGLIGSTLVRCLLALNEDINIIAPVRALRKAQEMFPDAGICLRLIVCDLLTFNYDNIENVDYIVHCAAPTSSRYFIEHPVETFDTIVVGTSLLLKYAMKHSIESFVYLSSLETYGSVLDDNVPISEDKQGYLDLMSVRSSYPMAKRATENLCSLYVKEYNIPVKVARLTQTTGAGIASDDNRVIAQFARLVSEGEDIILHTTGEAARPYCYTIDAVSAILYILLRGKDGESYNVANEATYISIKDMAEFLRYNFNPNINVRVEIKDDMGYAPVTKLRLSSQKLMALGWRPKYNLNDIFEKLIKSLK